MREETEKTPLKTILQNFLNHVETLETKRAEGEDLYEKEFQSLKAFSDDLKNKEEFSSSEGDRDVNKKKNRYKDILPYNYTRVLLSEYPGVPGSDYINASYIKGASGSNAYIASQGPLPNTVNEWWRMVVECEVQVIVMACNEQEGGKHKCEAYWTAEEGESGPPTKLFGKFSVSLLKSRAICPDFLVRTMRLSWLNESGDATEERTVCQFHYSAWPDHSVPTEVKPLLEMVRLIRDCQASETLPVLVHCSAGCGRTGTICAIDFVWGLLRTGKLDSSFSLYNLVKDMRRQRIAMVQTVDQYMLCHRAVRELFLEQLRVIDSHHYENVGQDGRPLCETGGQASQQDYETILVEGQHIDIEKVLSQRQNLPRMGVNMIGREKESPCTVQSGSEQGKAYENGVPNSEGSESSLPLTLDEFKGSAKSSPGGTPKIHEPPQGGPEGSQKFKRGDLRLVQVDDGGWKLEQFLQEEKRRSLEAGNGPRNNSFEKLESSLEENLVSKPLVKPPQSNPIKERKKKNSKDEKEKGENQLLRRPSMKKIKAFFDKDKNKENRETAVETENADSSQDAEMTSRSVETDDSDNPSAASPHDNFGGSKSVPSSLDRRTVRLKEGPGDLSEDQGGSISLAKKSHHHPVKSVSSERLQAGEKPALPVKRSKSMKSISKPVSVIPVLNSESSFAREDFRYDRLDGSYEPLSKHKTRTEELIDLTRKSSLEPPKSPAPVSDNSSKFNFDSNSQPPPLQPSNKHTYHFGERNNDIKPNINLVPPPKPKRDWSSLNHDYANLKISSGDQQPHLKMAPKLTHGKESLDKENLRHQMRDYVNLNVGSGAGDPGGSGQVKQFSGDSKDKSSEFFDQQMAKLLARKGRDEIDGAALNMKRSKSGDIPRPDNLSIARSISGDLKSSGAPRNSEILDDDAKKMLKDCQEYLLGAFEPPEDEFKLNKSSESSPLGTLNKSIGGRSVHSSPGNSFNKYGYSNTQLKRSSSGNINLSPPGSKTFCSPNAQRLADMTPSPSHNKTLYESPENVGTSDVSEPSESAKQSPLSEYGPSSFESRLGHDYEYFLTEPNFKNLGNNNLSNVTMEARGKLSLASNVRGRERRNSFRQAVTDKPPPQHDSYGRPYEQIWFQSNDGDQNLQDSVQFSKESVETQMLPDGPVYANASQAMQPLRKSDTGSVISLRSQSSGGHVKSGSYDNLPSVKETVGLSPSHYPPGATQGYEVVNFSPQVVLGSDKKNSIDSVKSSESIKAALQSVGLVAEACRDYERSQPPKKHVLSKQVSGSNLRGAPPPYLAPPGPPPPYQPPPGNSQHNSRQTEHKNIEAPSKKPDMSHSPQKVGLPSPQGTGVQSRGYVAQPSQSSPQPSSVNSRHTSETSLRLSRDDADPCLLRQAVPSQQSQDRDRRQQRKRNSSLVTMTRLGHTDFNPQGGAPGPPGYPVVAGARTAVHVGGSPSPLAPMQSPLAPPGTIDLDRVAASMAGVGGGSQEGGGNMPLDRQRMHFSRSLSSVAGGLSGLARDIKSKLAGMAGGGGIGVRQVREQQGEEKSPRAIPITVPGAADRQSFKDYGYPLRLEKRPQGPRDTPNFQKKQEYL